MKLISKFTLWYFIITFFVLITGGIIIVNAVQKAILEEEVYRLKGITEDIASEISKETPLSNLINKQVKIEELDTAKALIQFYVIDTIAWHSTSHGTERVLIASVSYKINGKHYLIRASTYIMDTIEIVGALIQSIFWIILLLLFFGVLAGRQISKTTIRPLTKILQSIQSFTLKQNKPIQLPRTQIKEFAELNLFLEKTTSKALDDYRSLKEFTENASHELQTPLSIIRGKLELLMESTITEEQSHLILTAYNSVEKLSKINQSLILLANIENIEYDDKQNIDFSYLTNNALNAYAEMIEMKSIHFQKEIQEKVLIWINPMLADILLSNLIINAIRHNLVGGEILVKLTRKNLVIENTGNPPNVPTNELFHRFKKSNQNAESIGLGLAIVKRICDLYKFQIDYKYSKQYHIIEVVFRQ